MVSSGGESFSSMYLLMAHDDGSIRLSVTRYDVRLAMRMIRTRHRADVWSSWMVDTM